MRFGYLVAAAASIAAAPPAFTFQSIEFAPSDERLPAAQAFLADAAAPGTPLPRAIDAVEKGGARCTRRPAADGAVVCHYSRPISHSFADMPMGDVTWTVRLLATPAGIVRSSAVDRQEFGG